MAVRTFADGGADTDIRYGANGKMNAVNTSNFSPNNISDTKYAQGGKTPVSGSETPYNVDDAFMGAQGVQQGMGMGGGNAFTEEQLTSGMPRIETEYLKKSDVNGKFSNKNILSLKDANAYVEEARYASREWRAESWRDSEMYDGKQWSYDDFTKAQQNGIEPLTINRIFPAINMIIGSQEINQANIIAKARTQKDGKTAEIITEGIAYILDQSDGKKLLQRAFKDSIVPGIGWLYAGFSNDPREERIKVEFRDWKEVYFDPFGSPWLEPSSSRYMYFQRWMDLFDLQLMFPEKKKELDEKFRQFSSANYTNSTGYGYYQDEADQLEWNKRMGTTLGMSSFRWALTDNRKRVRPAQLWYSVMEKGTFALFEDGGCIEIDLDARTDDEIRRTYSIVQSAQYLTQSTVRKLRVKTFLGDYELEDRPSPFHHNEYPFIPFVGYVDRNGNPYGVPRMIRGQNEEVNKRRSMDLALLQKRRLIVDEGVSDDLQAVYEEANKLDGMVVVKPNMMNGVQMIDNSPLSQYQMALMQQSEVEIQQISGANNESSGYESNAQSGRAIEMRRQQASVMLSELFGNYNRSLSRLGKILTADMRQAWTGEKVLRVTDKMTSAERFVVMNRKVMRDGQVIEIKNDINQGTYDIVVTNSPSTDTIREQNMNLLMEWMKTAPNEIQPYLFGLAMELSNLPNKDGMMMKLRPMLGITDGETEDDVEAIKAAQEQAEAMKAQQAQELQQLQKTAAELDIQNKQLQNAKLMAEIEKIKADTAGVIADTETMGREQERKEFETGVSTGQKIQYSRMAEKNAEAMMAKAMRESPDGRQGTPTPPMGGAQNMDPMVRNNPHNLAVGGMA